MTVKELIERLNECGGSLTVKYADDHFWTNKEVTDIYIVSDIKGNELVLLNSEVV